MGKIVEFENTNRGELQINMSHAITRASHGLSLVEKRIVALFIAKFCGKKHIRGVRGELIPVEDRQIKVTADEYADTFNISKDMAYRDLKHSAKRFLKRHWTLHKPEGGVLMGNWLEAIHYHDDEGFVIAEFTNRTTPHLVVALGEQFTKYRLKATAALTGTYTWRLWELLSQYADPSEKKKRREEERWVRITLDEFRHMMGAPKSYRYPDIRVRIIEPAIKQISSKNEIKVVWRAIKKGRSVNSLEFRFTPSEQLSLFGADYT